MNAPERIYRVSSTQLSLARHFGGVNFNGVEYHYDPTTDTLTRLDVWKADASSKVEADKAERKKLKQAQGVLEF